MTAATLLLSVSTSPRPRRYCKVSRIPELRGCFSEHSTLSVSLELKSKPSTVDCTLWPTTISTRGFRNCWRQETKAEHTGTFPSLGRGSLKGHNQHSLLSVGWTVWTSSTEQQCNHSRIGRRTGRRPTSEDAQLKVGRSYASFLWAVSTRPNLSGSN